MKKVITYEAPDVTVFEIHTEGTLCQSCGDANEAGSKVNENPEFEYDM
jgi:hypothetical protein